MYADTFLDLCACVRIARRVYIFKCVYVDLCTYDADVCMSACVRLDHFPRNDSGPLG